MTCRGPNYIRLGLAWHAVLLVIAGGLVVDLSTCNYRLGQELPLLNGKNGKELSDQNVDTLPMSGKTVKSQLFDNWHTCQAGRVGL